MRLSRFIASRYLFSKNNPNAINIISGISMLGFAVGAMALVTVMSVFNGFENLVQSLYNAFDPDIKVELLEGKAVNIDSLPLSDLRKIEGLEDFSYVIEENVAVVYDDKQSIALMKGVGKNYPKITHLDSMIYEGELVLQQGERDYAVLGLGVANRLGVSVFNDFTRLGIYVPKRGKGMSLNPEKMLNQTFLFPRGIFSIDDEINNSYVLVPLRLAQELLDYPHSISSLEIKTQPGSDIEEVKDEVKELLGPRFKVLNREEQQETLYKVFRYEKWATAVILAFILFLLTFTVISSLSMLVLEKRKDISILKSMGATNQSIKRIFLSEGMLIALLGGSIGLILGFGLCWAQETYGIIGFGGMGTFIVNAYPVAMKWTDFAVIFVLILLLGFLTAYFPARKAAKMSLRFQG